MTSSLTHVIKRDGRVVNFESSRIENAILLAFQMIRGSDTAVVPDLAQRVLTNLEGSYRDSVPNVEGIQDMIEFVLKSTGHLLIAEAFMVYRAGRQKVREGVIPEDVFVPDGVPRAKIQKIWKWNLDHQCESIHKLNQWVSSGKFHELVMLSIGEYERDLDRAVEKLLEKKNSRILIVAGPSSSGKTTTTYKMGQRLQKHGLRIVTLNLDNYFRGLEEYRTDEFGDKDFEDPHALRLELINEHLKALVGGEVVKTPLYDFKLGKRFDNHTDFALKSDEILLLDSLHGLYPEMTEGIPENMKFRLFIGTFNVLKDHEGRYTRWTDIRLLRRMLRDKAHRNHDYQNTVSHWHYVTNAELKHIVPFIGTADTIVNGGLSFELPILKHYILPHFPSSEVFAREPKKLDARIRAERVRKLLEEVVEFSKPETVPSDCHLREFIGGSSIDVHSLFDFKKK